MVLALHTGTKVTIVYLSGKSGEQVEVVNNASGLTIRRGTQAGLYP
jgi:hypothetical protein